MSSQMIGRCEVMDGIAGRHQFAVAGAVICMHQCELPVMSFHECGTVFDPVACVAIGHTVQFMNLRRMNVTANDSVAPSMTSMSGEVALELLNILRQCRESALDSGDQRSVPITEHRVNQPQNELSLSSPS